MIEHEEYIEGCRQRMPSLYDASWALGSLQHYETAYTGEYSHIKVVSRYIDGLKAQILELKQGVNRVW